MIATLYNVETGARGRVVRGSEEDIAAQLLPGEAWIKGDHRGKWINPKTCRPNKLRRMKARGKYNVLSGLPEGTVARFGGQEVTVEGGKLRLASPVPRTLTVELTHPTHAPKTVTLQLRRSTTGHPVDYDYRTERRDEYARRGLPIEALTIALIEGDDAEIERIRTERQAVKDAIPKPEG